VESKSPIKIAGLRPELKEKLVFTVCVHSVSEIFGRFILKNKNGTASVPKNACGTADVGGAQPHAQGHAEDGHQPFRRKYYYFLNK